MTFSIPLLTSSECQGKKDLCKANFLDSANKQSAESTIEPREGHHTAGMAVEAIVGSCGSDQCITRENTGVLSNAHPQQFILAVFIQTIYSSVEHMCNCASTCACVPLFSIFFWNIPNPACMLHRRIHTRNRAAISFETGQLTHDLSMAVSVCWGGSCCCFGAPCLCLCRTHGDQMRFHCTCPILDGHWHMAADPGNPRCHPQQMNSDQHSDVDSSGARQGKMMGRTVGWSPRCYLCGTCPLKSRHPSETFSSSNTVLS